MKRPGEGEKLAERPELIVALDVDYSKVIPILEALGEGQVWYKVGYELFTQAGPKVIKELKERGKKVFLDLKFFDIPNTMARAAVRCCELGVDMFNLHLRAGEKALEWVSNAVSSWQSETGTRPLVIGVTYLTSESAGEKEVLELVQLAQRYHLDGVVCSVWEVRAIKSLSGENFLTVCPGIRRESDSNDDQVRVATPQMAKEVGADYIVMGRSILKDLVDIV